MAADALLAAILAAARIGARGGGMKGLAMKRRQQLQSSFAAWAWCPSKPKHRPLPLERIAVQAALVEARFRNPFLGAYATYGSAGRHHGARPARCSREISTTTGR